MGISERLALTTDREAKDILNRVISGLLPTQPALARPTDLALILAQLGREIDSHAKPDIDRNLRDESKAIRFLLWELAQNPDTKQRLESATQSNRTVLAEPITNALIMAAVVALVQTHARISIKYVRGKLSVEFDAKKETGSSIEIIKNILRVFG